MVDWTASMTQTYEFWTVDPISWADRSKIDVIISGSMDRDAETDTLQSASLKSTELINETYIRVYMIIGQNGMIYKETLGTFLFISPKDSFDGKCHTYDIDGYSPLIELKEKLVPIGYSLHKNANIMQNAGKIIQDNMRGPVVFADDTTELSEEFVANNDDNWLTYNRDLIARAKYKYDMDADGTLIFAPIQDLDSLQPRFYFNDDNSSILLPSITIDRDIYDIPNVLEVIYSNDDAYVYSEAVNEDEDSPTSTVNRGRRIVKRISDPELPGIPTQEQLDKYAVQLLKDLSSVEYKVSYTHGYCPVRVNDCVLLNYERAGLNNVKAKVISQNIPFESGCTVTETAIFPMKLWR